MSITHSHVSPVLAMDCQPFRYSYHNPFILQICREIRKVRMLYSVRIHNYCSVVAVLQRTTRLWMSLDILLKGYYNLFKRIRMINNYREHFTRRQLWCSHRIKLGPLEILVLPFQFRIHSFNSFVTISLQIVAQIRPFFWVLPFSNFYPIWCLEGLYFWLKSVAESTVLLS